MIEVLIDALAAHRGRNFLILAQPPSFLLCDNLSVIKSAPTRSMRSL
jgi:hypothetical protein